MKSSKRDPELEKLLKELTAKYKGKSAQEIHDDFNSRDNGEGDTQDERT